MRIQVEESLCAGFGACNDSLPEVFALDAYGFAKVTGGGHVPPGKEGLARRAVDRCPARAIVELDAAMEARDDIPDAGEK